MKSNSYPTLMRFWCTTLCLPNEPDVMCIFFTLFWVDYEQFFCGAGQNQCYWHLWSAGGSPRNESCTVDGLIACFVMVICCDKVWPGSFIIQTANLDSFIRKQEGFPAAETEERKRHSEGLSHCVWVCASHLAFSCSQCEPSGLFLNV
jgi:hypothetical protein